MRRVSTVPSWPLNTSPRRSTGCGYREAYMVDERRCALMERLRPIMGEDSSIAADILIQALRREFNELVKKEDQVRYQAAFDRLPQGSTAKPRLAFISHDNDA